MIRGYLFWLLPRALISVCALLLAWNVRLYGLEALTGKVSAIGMQDVRSFYAPKVVSYPVHYGWFWRRSSGPDPVRVGIWVGRGLTHYRGPRHGVILDTWCSHFQLWLICIPGFVRKLEWKSVGMGMLIAGGLIFPLNILRLQFVYWAMGHDYPWSLAHDLPKDLMWFCTISLAACPNLGKEKCSPLPCAS